MKTITIEPKVLDYPTSSLTTIDIRIYKKEYDILTKDCLCIIDEVDFVKIIDTTTQTPLPVVAAPKPTTTATPRKSIHKFVSRILNRMAVLPLTMPLCLVLVLGVGNVWGQAITEGFESTFPATDWSNSGCIQSTNSFRSGSKSLAFNGASDAITSPLVSSPSTLTFYYRRSSNSAAWNY
jgi:hypothetical protein